MERALELARQGEGLTRPNPPVGAVLLKGAQVIGEGFHRRAGAPHAEIEALRRCEQNPRGSTLVVTLEPCSTQGRTPPCTEAILAAGIRRVVVGTVDPNPKHAGRGLVRLQENGVEVESGVCEEAAQELISGFRMRILQGRPQLTLKMGVSLDGRIADRKGCSQWITGVAARERVQDLRRRTDAILVGAGTVRLDDPSLIPRPARGRKPWRVVIDGQLSSPLSSKLYTDRYAQRTIVCCLSSSSQARRKRLTHLGVQVRDFPGKRVSFLRALRMLGREFDVMNVLCEGGGIVAEGLLREGLVDLAQWFIAPCWIGGGLSGNALAGSGFPLASAPHSQVIGVEQLGEDVLVQLQGLSRKGA